MTNPNMITAQAVPNSSRMQFLPKYFGLRLGLQFEAKVYVCASLFFTNYSGGEWEFVELSNGGVLMRLSEAAGEQQPVKVSGNGFAELLSRDAAGALATHGALLMMAESGIERATELLYLLQDYIAQHPERSLLRAALD